MPACTLSMYQIQSYCLAETLAPLTKYSLQNYQQVCCNGKHGSLHAPCPVNTTLSFPVISSHKLKKHILAIIPPFYEIGTSVDRATAQQNIEKALNNGNFMFCSYGVTVSFS